jgi:hypothetical protein
VAITNNPVTANPGMSRTWTRPPLRLGGAFQLHTNGSSNLSYNTTTIKFVVLRDIVNYQRQHGCGGHQQLEVIIFDSENLDHGNRWAGPH